ncbi:hypothetical protein GCM10023116_38270 [Kistimonas scapharcae]|uniref:WH2 domain-containing protein n=1 Tax=Kistimonas scapharcae TaxID=1036133 RepID=A0ABP8V5K3_9GAMM
MEGPHGRHPLTSNLYSKVSQKQESEPELVSQTEGQPIISKGSNAKASASLGTKQRSVGKTDNGLPDPKVLEGQINENIKNLWLAKIAKNLDFLKDPACKPPECITEITIRKNGKVIYSYPDPGKTSGLDDGIIEQVRQALPQHPEEELLSQTKNNLALYKQVLLDQKQKESNPLESVMNSLKSLANAMLHWRDSLISSTELEVTGQLPDSHQLIHELENSEMFKKRQKHLPSEDEMNVTMEAVPVVYEGDGEPLCDENNNLPPASVDTAKPILPDITHQPPPLIPQDMPPPPPPPPPDWPQSSKNKSQPVSSPPKRYAANVTDDHANAMKSLNDDFAKFDRQKLRKTETNSKEQIQQRKEAIQNADDADPMDKTLDEIRSFNKSSMKHVETNSSEHIADREKVASKTPWEKHLDSIRSFKPETLKSTQKKDNDK